jgi:hypothetical protein
MGFRRDNFATHYGPKVRRALLLAACFAMVGAAGYVCGRSQEGSSLTLPLQKRIPLSFYATESSFSEVENTKATLEALCTELLTELRLKYDGRQLVREGPYSGSLAYVLRAGDAEMELEKAIQQFQGTEQEGALVNELLYLLNRRERYERWLEVYVRFLYARPIDPIAGRHARRALTISHSIGREDELMRALEWLLQNELNSPSKTEIQAEICGPWPAAGMPRWNEPLLARTGSAWDAAAHP